MSRTMNWVRVTCGTLTEKNSNSWGKEGFAEKYGTHKSFVQT